MAARNCGLWAEFAFAEVVQHAQHLDLEERVGDAAHIMLRCISAESTSPRRRTKGESPAVSPDPSHFDECSALRACGWFPLGPTVTSYPERTSVLSMRTSTGTNFRSRPIVPA